MRLLRRTGASSPMIGAMGARAGSAGGTRARRRILVLVATAALGVTTLVTALPGGRTHRPSAQAYELTASSCPSSKQTAFGYPRWVVGCHIGGQGFTSPVAGTIDGVKVVVDASLSGWVYVVNALTGREMPGWPEKADLVGSTATAIDSSPAIAYLNGPAREPSIVVGLGSLYVKDQYGGVMAWNANGSVRFRFRTDYSGSTYSKEVFATPAIGDVTGSGQQDIVFGSYNHRLYALTPSGKPLHGFPVNRADTIWSSPALVDTTHSGKMDIIEGGDASGWSGPSGGTKCWSGWVSDYRYESGSPHLIWERCLKETVWSSPAVTTFGTTPVVVVGTSWYHASNRVTQPAEDEVFAFNARTGKTMPGWPVKAGGPTFGSPVVVPATPRGPNEVVESSCADCLDGPSIVTAWSESGTRLWQTKITLHSELLASPSVANLTNGLAGWNSTANDVLIGNVAGLFVLNAKTGKKVAGTATGAINPSCNVGGSAVMSAVPGSKTGYMMFTNCGFNGPTRTANEYLRAYDVPAPASPAPWPMFRANAQRTGVPDPYGQQRASCSVPATPSGYRIVGTAGSLYHYGSSPYCGDLAAELLPKDVAGIAATPDGGGYWIALKDGAVYAFGDAHNYGDLRGDSWQGGTADAAPGAPVVGIAATPDGKGYYLLGGDGSVYAFGDARYAGSVGKYTASGAPTAIAVDDATGGYWIATSSGRVYDFGGAPALGSQLSGHASPIVAMAALHTGSGYWLVTASGAVFNIGSAPKLGGKFGTPMVGIAVASNDRGYYLASSKGNVFQFGKVPWFGSAAGKVGSDPITAIATP